MVLMHEVLVQKLVLLVDEFQEGVRLLVHGNERVPALLHQVLLDLGDLEPGHFFLSYFEYSSGWRASR
jgi:hypothetical protein